MKLKISIVPVYSAYYTWSYSTCCWQRTTAVSFGLPLQFLVCTLSLCRFCTPLGISSGHFGQQWCIVFWVCSQGLLLIIELLQIYFYWLCPFDFVISEHLRRFCYDHFFIIQHCWWNLSFSYIVKGPQIFISTKNCSTYCLAICIVGKSLHWAVCTATNTSYFPTKYNRLVTFCGKTFRGLTDLRWTDIRTFVLIAYICELCEASVGALVTAQILYIVVDLNVVACVCTCSHWFSGHSSDLLGLGSCPLIFLLRLFRTCASFLGHANAFHIFLDTIPPDLAWTYLVTQSASSCVPRVKTISVYPS